MRRGFTLLEAILALALTILLMSGVAAFYQTSLSARDKGRKLALEAIQTRSMLDRITEELHQAVSIIPGDGKGFEGTKDSITIVLSRLPAPSVFNEYEQSDQLPPAQTDIMRVAYTLYWDEEERVDDDGNPICYGVWRTEQKTFDPNPKYTVQNQEPGEEEQDMTMEVAQPDVSELYAPEIKYLRFEYFDGLKWRDNWNVTMTADGQEKPTGSDESKPLPQAVRITMGRKPLPADQLLNLDQFDEERDKREKLIHHADRFTTVVYLPQADQSSLSSRKKGATSDLEQMGEQTSGGL